jgi:hypothetical protein
VVWPPPSIARLRARLERRLVPWAVYKLLDLDAEKVVPKLRQAGAHRILLDNTVRGLSVTHETAWIDTGQKMWGDIPFRSGFAARIPVHSHDHKSRELESIRYLPMIAHLTRNSHLVLFDSYELRDEGFRQPSKRFNGTGVNDYSIFDGISFDLIDRGDQTHSRIINLESNNNLAAEQRGRLKMKAADLFHAICDVIGGNSSQDAWHIYTAEIKNCYCL